MLRLKKFQGYIHLVLVELSAHDNKSVAEFLAYGTDWKGNLQTFFEKHEAGSQTSDEKTETPDPPKPLPVPDIETDGNDPKEKETTDRIPKEETDTDGGKSSSEEKTPDIWLLALILWPWCWYPTAR